MVPSRSRRVLALAALSGVALLSAACGGDDPVAARNVVLIVVDTLGADDVGAYGAPTRTPNLDRLAAEGVRFERAFSPSPWTKPAIASLLTGLVPARHGLHEVADRLPDRLWTLAEHAAASGIETHAVVSHVFVTARHGFRQGFQGFDASAVGGHTGISSERVTDRSLAFLDARGGGRFLLLAHYFDPHYVYHRHPRFPHTGDYEGIVEPGMDVWELRDRRAELSPADVAHLRGLHREEIAYTDFHVGRLLAGLRERGLAHDTLVVLTADHGEEFMEHGWLGHTRTLYDELLRVPLIFAWPGRIPPAVIREPVSLVDVAPTVAELAGLPARPEWEGASLADGLRHGAPLPVRPVFAEVAFGVAPHANRASRKSAHKTAVIVGARKLIHDRDSDAYELYDLEADAAESVDLWRPEMAADSELYRALARWEASARGERASAVEAFDEATLEALRQLGYVR